MNSDIANIWETIQGLADNYHRDGGRAQSIFYAESHLREELQQHSLSFADAVVDGNSDASLIKRIGSFGVLVGFAELCFRVCTFEQTDGPPQIFIDFLRDAVNYAEYHWADNGVGETNYYTDDDEGDDDVLSDAGTISDSNLIVGDVID